MAHPTTVSDDAAAEHDQNDGQWKEAIREAAVDLVAMQHHVINRGLKVLVILEGRDGAGKDGAIRRITKHMSPRDTHVVAFGKPTDLDNRAWYFERWIGALPVAGEITFFNRSWYNRAGVERVMDFCTKEEVENFLVTTPMFEGLLSHCGFQILKYYLDITKSEQKRRLKSRRDDPLKQWKSSAVDEAAIAQWDAYTRARDKMLRRTSTTTVPWTIVRADDKRAAQLAIMRDLRQRVGKKHKHPTPPDPLVLQPFTPTLIEDGFIAS